MSARTHHPPTRVRHRLGAGMATLLVCLAATSVAPAAATAATVEGPNGTSLTVTPSVINSLTGEVIVQVSGSGYSTTKNNGFGIYLSFGPEPVGPRAGNVAFTDVSRYYNGGDGHGTLWVTPGTPSGPNQAKLESNGTFSVSFAVKATYTGGTTSYDGTNETLGVLTYAAHGSEASASDTDSQFVFVPLAFEAGPPATAPSAPDKPVASGASPTSVSVAWTAPADGGDPITGYTVTVRNGSGTTVAATESVGAVTSAVITGLAADTSYNAIVAATNGVGTSAPSVASDVVRTAPDGVAADFGGLRWKVSHQAWTSSSLGTHEVVDPATRGADGFLFPPAAVGSYDPATGEAHATFSGTASIGNVNQGGYRIWFGAPSLDVDASGNGSISADVSYRTSAAGTVTGPSRVVVATFSGATAHITEGTDHVVIESTLDTTFSTALIDYLASTLRGHFQATGAASDPLKAPAPIAAGFDHPEIDDPLSEVVVISTEVVATGALVLSVDDASVTLTSPALDANGDLFATGELNPIRVVDLRSSNPGWNVTGQVSDFTGPNDATIDGNGLSWNPVVLDSSDGQTVTPGAAGNGLKDGQVLGSAADGQGRGTAVLGGELVLEVPSSTPTGTYQARLTLTAI